MTSTTSTSNARPRRALEGIRILELTVAVAGPVAGHVLADMGVEQIKIEAPFARPARVPHPTPLKEGAPNRPYNRGPQFNELNRSKRLVSLDLAKPAGRDAFLRLVEISDAVIENFSPRVLKNLRLDYPELRAVNPGIVLVSMPAFGKTGPYENRSSYGPGIDAMSGIAHLTGYPNRGPGKPANYYCDHNAGVLAAFSTLAAIRHRRRTGVGQYIELAMLEGELQVCAPALLDAAVNGREQMRTGNRHPWMAPHGVYPSAGEDEWVAVAVDTGAQWRALCEAIERPDLAADPGLATASGRRARHDELDEAISAWTAARTKQDAEDRLQAAGIPAGALSDTAELLEHPQLVAREAFTWVDHPEGGPFPHTRTAWRSLRGNEGAAAPAPLFADSNDYVLGELLGMTPAEIANLEAAGIVAREPKN